MTIDEVLKYFKTQYRVCKELEISRQNFTKWIEKGYIPYTQQHRLENLTEGKLKANIDDLFDRFTHHGDKTKLGIQQKKGS
jgi:hypothetical protein